MLFGNEKIQNIICNKAKDLAGEINGKIIFGAMVGSISQGVQAVDSDYDTRFLYIRNDFPENILQPDACKETDIVMRYYPKEETFYDKIPLWEFTSFLQFIATPSIDSQFSVGLHHNIAWTFLSPYVWDPFGLSIKLSPMIYRACNVQYELGYHLSRIEEFFQRGEDILIKNYLYSFIAAASINYIKREFTYAPIHIDSLIGLEPVGDIRRVVSELIERMRTESALYVKQSESFVMQGSHYLIRTRHDQLLDQYICEAYQIGKVMLNKVERRDNKIDVRELLEEMYAVADRSMREQIVKGVG